MFAKYIFNAIAVTEQAFMLKNKRGRFRKTASLKYNLYIG
jgi:hypothetical protein